MPNNDFNTQLEAINIHEEYNANARIVFPRNDIRQFIKTLPSASIDLILTSPPYNLGKVYEERLPIEEYLAAYQELIPELYRVLRDSGSVCWQTGNYVLDGEIFPLDIYFYPYFHENRFRLRNRIIWHYGHGLHAKRRFSGRYETILWFTKSDEYVFNLDDVRVPSKYPGKRHSKGPNKGKPSGNPKGKNPSDYWDLLCGEWSEGVWNIPNVKANHVEKTEHPCQFPVELAERCILALTNEGDTVLDPFAGVGSSIIAALKTERRAIGCEKEDQYVNIAHQRIRDFYSGTLKMRRLGTPVHNPKSGDKVAQIPDEWKDIPENIYFDAVDE